jgi:hypothetical protein
MSDKPTNLIGETIHALRLSGVIPPRTTNDIAEGILRNIAARDPAFDKAAELALAGADADGAFAKAVSAHAGNIRRMANGESAMERPEVPTDPVDLVNMNANDWESMTRKLKRYNSHE